MGSGDKPSLANAEDSLALLSLAKETTDMAIQYVPIVSSYNDRIRPLLDAVDKLRHLNVSREGIQLPTIVVVGDQSSGKSSVLESLAGISLPRGQGICTRVPLIMRLQHHPTLEPDLYLEFNGKVVPTSESDVADAINVATNEIAGDGKGISNNPLTLVVKKNGVPDLTMIDLPGITRVPVRGQPEDIYEQIREIIMEYIKPEESIILNVLSATVDFSTCESIRMSQQVDKTGERTLGVVTKADKNPEGLLEKVTADDVNIGLGYVCAELKSCPESDPKKDFLMQEIHILEEMKGVHLPNFFPRDAFSFLLRAKVERISIYPVNFIEKVWAYIEDVVMTIVMHHSENYHQLQSSIRRAGHNLVEKMKMKSMSWVNEYIEMEKVTDYTCDTDYESEWSKPMAQQALFVKNVCDGFSVITIDTIGDVPVVGLVNYQQVLREAYDLKMRMVSYWKIVLRRLVDVMVLHFQLSIRNLVNKEIKKDIIAELIGAHGGAIERMLEESPSVASKRRRLNMSVKLLRESKEVVANVMDRIASYGD